MRIVPRKKQPQIQFFLTHLEQWADRAEEIGTSPEMVATLADQTEEARAALAAQQQAQMAAESATLNLRIALKVMATTGAAIVSQIRTKAKMSGNGVYTLASIRSPAKASPIGPPGEPTQFTYALKASGALKLSWNCKNPRGSVGTMYQVSRRIGSDGELVPVGLTGNKHLVDETIPAGATQVIYQVQAVRSTAVGPIATFNVNFGNVNFSTGRSAPARMNVAA